MQIIVTGRAGDAHAQFELLVGSSHESVSNSKRASRSHAKTGLFPVSFLAHFWTLFSCLVLERFLEALFGVPGSILGSFWSHFGHIFDDFWCQVRYARIALPLQRESNFRGSGGSRVPPFSLFFQLRF